MKPSVIEGRHYRTGEHILLTLKEGIISEIRATGKEDIPSLPWIAPGLVDLQLNGFGGLDLNTLPIAENLVQKLTRKLWSEGLTSFYPTIITNSDKAITEAMKVLDHACSAESEKSVKGIHLEGPFISPEDGPRGAHEKSYVKAPDWGLFQKWQDAAGGRIKIVTLSPEWPNVCRFIEKASQSGVKVSIGHTAATPDQIREAVRAGARLSTHFGNGAHLMLPRHPNYLWAQLSEDDLSTCVIADGFHLPDSVLKVVFKIKKEKAILVSDAVFLSGMEPGNYETHIGGEVVLSDEGRLYLEKNPQLLAGSVKMLTKGIEHLVESGLLKFGEAWEAASVRPAAFMDLPEREGLSPGAPANFVLFEYNQKKVTILQTYLEGKLVFDTKQRGAEKMFDD